MPTKAEIQAQIDALTADLANAEDDGDDYEVEIWDGEGKGARVPYSRARSYLQEHFGIGLDPPATDPSDDSGTDDTAGKAKGKGRTNPPATSGTATRYFGKRQAPGK